MHMQSICCVPQRPTGLATGTNSEVTQDAQQSVSFLELYIGKSRNTV